MEPFRLSYTLTRRQRLAVELPPWLPAIAATLGFGLGSLYAGLYASHWLLLLLVLPPLVYRGLFVFAYDVIVRGGRPVVITESEGELVVQSGGRTKFLPLAGIFQVFREGDVWSVLHLDGTVLTIPANAITAEQVDYLRVFVHRAAAARAAHG